MERDSSTEREEKRNARSSRQQRRDDGDRHRERDFEEQLEPRRTHAYDVEYSSDREFLQPPASTSNEYRHRERDRDKDKERASGSGREKGREREKPARRDESERDVREHRSTQHKTPKVASQVVVTGTLGDLLKLRRNEREKDKQGETPASTTGSTPTIPQPHAVESGATPSSRSSARNTPDAQSKPVSAPSSSSPDLPKESSSSLAAASASVSGLPIPLPNLPPSVPLDQIPPPSDSRTPVDPGDNSLDMNYPDGHAFTKMQTIPPPPPNVAQAVESIDEPKQHAFKQDVFENDSTSISLTPSGTRLCTLPNLPLPQVDDIEPSGEMLFDAGNNSSAASSRSSSPSASSAASDDGESAAAFVPAPANTKASRHDAKRSSRSSQKRSHADGSSVARVRKRRRVGASHADLRALHTSGPNLSLGGRSSSSLPDISFSRGFSSSSSGGGSPLAAPGASLGGATAGMRLPALCERRLERPSPFSCGRRSIEAFEIVAQIGEGTYGHVYKARDLASGIPLLFAK